MDCLVIPYDDCDRKRARGFGMRRAAAGPPGDGNDQARRLGALPPFGSWWVRRELRCGTSLGNVRGSIATCVAPIKAGAVRAAQSR
jgi:hypothetical protein